VLDAAGKTAFDIDSCVGIDIGAKAKAAQFPVEKGAFANYDKVTEPIETKVVLTTSGATRITALLAALNTARTTATLFTVVMPEASYQNMTLVHFNVKRERGKGVNLISVETQWLEIRQVTPAYSTVTLPPNKVKKPGSSSKVDQGKNQTQPPAPPWSPVGKSLSEIAAHAKAAAGAK
jgi:hypothetical protein